MAKTTGISWCDATFNIAWGCCKVSPGCQHCYAETLSDKRYGKNLWVPAATTRRQMMSDTYWKAPLHWNKQAEVNGKRLRVFCGSMCDWAEDHPDLVEPRERLYTLIEQTPDIDWLLLTKRPENMERFMPKRWERYNGGVPINIWFGTSAEDQKRFNERWPALQCFAMNYGASVTFLSLEPLLGPINLNDAFEEIDIGDEDRRVWTRSVDWVIVGGESGADARPMELDWARQIRDQCLDEGVDFFFKQVGGNKRVDGVWGGDRLDGEVYHAWPVGFEIPRFMPPAPPEQPDMPQQLSLF